MARRVRTQGLFEFRGETARILWVDGDSFERSRPIALRQRNQFIGPRPYLLDPVHTAERGRGIGHQVSQDPVRMGQDISEGQAGSQRLTNDKPVCHAERFPDAFKRLHVSLRSVLIGIVGGRRPTVAEQLNHHRAAHRRQRLQIGQPLRPAGEKAVQHQRIRSLSGPDFVVRQQHGRCS